MERKKLFIATEIDLTDEGTHLCYHEFEATDYRSLVSYGAFTGVKDRCYSKTRLYHCKQKHLWTMEMKFQNGSKRLPILLIHPSIWDFYKFIGYDYKKKKHMKD